MSIVPTEVFEARSTIDRWNDDYYHPIAMRLYDSAIADMLRSMNAEPGATIVDAGCGPGAHTIRVARAGYRVCAIDISGAMLDYARQAVGTANVDQKVDFYQQDLANLHFPDSSFRYVFSWGVIIHIPEATKVLDELTRIIEPGGRLALYLTNRSAWDHKIEAAARIIARKPMVGIKRAPLGDGVWYEMNGEKLWLWRFNAGAITDYLAAKGFRLIKRRIGEISATSGAAKGTPATLVSSFEQLSVSPESTFAYWLHLAICI